MFYINKKASRNDKHVQGTLQQRKLLQCRLRNSLLHCIITLN